MNGVSVAELGNTYKVKHEQYGGAVCQSGKALLSAEGLRRGCHGRRVATNIYPLGLPPHFTCYHFSNVFDQKGIPLIDELFTKLGWLTGGNAPERVSVLSLELELPQMRSSRIVPYLQRNSRQKSKLNIDDGVLDLKCFSSPFFIQSFNSKNYFWYLTLSIDLADWFVCDWFVCRHYSFQQPRRCELQIECSSCGLIKCCLFLFFFKWNDEVILTLLGGAWIPWKGKFS